MKRLHTPNKVVGLKQSTKAVRQGRAALAYVAQDAAPWIKEPFLELCASRQVQVVQAATMKELAKHCHVEVPVACAVICHSCEA